MNEAINASTDGVSVVIPAFNEGAVVGEVLERLDAVMRRAGRPYEIIVVNDGSSDNTAEVIASCGVSVRLLNNPVNMGYGFSLKRGFRAAKHDRVAITDADGTYPLERIPELTDKLDDFDMVVGARTGKNFKSSPPKTLARLLFHALARYVTGNKIPDINSGLRIYRKDLVTAHERHISNGFSFTTTTTLLAFLTHRFVCYVPIEYGARKGTKSKVNMLRDTARCAQILVETLLVYNPMKVFLLFGLLPVVFSILCLPLTIWGGVSFAGFSLLFGLSAAILVWGIGFLAVILSRSRPV